MLKLEPLKIDINVQVSASSLVSGISALSNKNRGDRDCSVAVTNGKTYALIRVAGACQGGTNFTTALYGCNIIAQTEDYSVMGDGGEWAAGQLLIVKATASTITWSGSGGRDIQQRRFAVIQLD